MSLLLPSRVGENLPASYESQENLSKLMRADPRGGKDQVTTRLALEYFKRTKDLQPGQFDGVKSWVKSTCVYVGAGMLTVGAIALAGYGSYLVVSRTNYGPVLAAGLCGTAWVSYKAGFRPVEYLKGLLAATVRDAANRAATYSTRSDEMSWDSKASEMKDCRKEIISQLLVVYDDCAKEIHDRYQHINIENVEGRLELKQMVEHLDKQLPTIELLLGKLDLAPHEIENILQRFKDKVRFVQRQACSLYPKKSCEKMNVELVARWSIKSIGEIAVPYTIRERAAIAKRCRLGILDRFAAYGSSALSGAGTFVGLTAALAGTALAINTYQNGWDSSTSKIRDLFKTESGKWLEGMDATAMAGLGVAGCGVVGASTALTVNKWREQAREFSENAEYVRTELNACIKDLKTIYDGMSYYLESLRMPERSSMAQALKAKLPSIREEIRRLGIVNDPAEILGKFEQACCKIHD